MLFRNDRADGPADLWSLISDFCVHQTLRRNQRANDQHRDPAFVQVIRQPLTDCWWVFADIAGVDKGIVRLENFCTQSSQSFDLTGS